MLLPVVSYEYPYLWANGLILFNTYANSFYFHRIKDFVECMWSYHFKKSLS